MSMPLNGYRLLMALPQFTGNRIDSLVVVVDRETVHDRYVVARTRTLEDPEWMYSLYFTSNLNTAVKRAYVAANVHLMPWKEIAA